MPTKTTTPKKSGLKAGSGSAGKASAKRAAPKKKPAKRAKTETATAPKPAPKTVKRTYVFAVGRRKQAIARVRWHNAGEGGIEINRRTLADYFPVTEQQQLIQAPLELTHQDAKVTISVRVAGGGSQGQAEAVRLGISRALVKIDGDLRLPLKRAGFLRRDPRVKERKKYGLKRARRAPQWQKR